MGEFIAEMQERLLPEYEQMKHYQIFTPEQVRECVRQRERMLLNITKSHLGVTEYLDFIIYENKLHKTITEKEKLMGLKLTGLKTSIATHIIRLYREMLGKFPHEERLWDNYIKFCKKAAPQEVAGIYEKMLSYHGGEPETWKKAALWLYEYNHLNITRVQEMLLRGLQRHPCSAMLNKCFFDIQLKEAAQSDSKRDLADNTFSEQDIQMERVAAVYRNSLANITDLNYFLKLLESCEDHSELTAGLQKNIIEDMQTKFSREPALWDALAKRELRGLHLGDLLSLDEDEDSGESCEKKSRSDTLSVWQPRSKKRCIELCVAVYKSAVEQLKTQEMWGLYLDAMLLLSRNNKSDSAFAQQCLAKALQDGHKSHLMHAKYYATLSTILSSHDSGLEANVRILTEALQHDQSLQMHELLMSAHIRCDDEPNVRKLFGDVHQNLGATGLPIWQMTISYYQARGDLKRVNEMYIRACRESWPEFVALRSDYLSYLWHNISPAKARDEYAKLALQPPMSMELHRRMIKLLQSSKQRDASTLKSWRMCHEFMSTHFGKKEPSVWIDYIGFERDHGEAKNISIVSQRAIATLEAGLVSVFETERALAHVGVVLNS